MTSRERVLRALNHEATDRPPFDCTITIDVYNKLIDLLELDIPKKTNCSIFLTVQLDPEIVDALGLDFVYCPLSPNKTHPAFQFGVDSYTDFLGVQYDKIYIGEDKKYLNYVNVNKPLPEGTMEELEAYPWPNPDEPSLFEGLRERAKDLHENTDKAVIGLFGATCFTEAMLMRGGEDWYVDLLADPEYATALMQKLADYYKRLYCNAIDECGEYLDIIRVDNDDFGTQEGLLISKDMYRELVAPIMKDFYDTIKTRAQAKNPNIKLLKHCCGAVSELMEDFAELGIDIIDPVQVAAIGMEPESLKSRFGDIISFHGGIDTQDVLPHGTPQEVKEFTENMIRIMADKGGYIVCPVHHVEGDVPPENLMAMRAAVYQEPLRFTTIRDWD